VISAVQNVRFTVLCPESRQSDSGQILPLAAVSLASKPGISGALAYSQNRTSVSYFRSRFV
jgi:hypothetical protein